MNVAITKFFAAIAALLQSLIGLTEQIDQGIGMLDVAVKDAAKRQKIRSAVDMKDYAKDYAKQYAKRVATSDAEIAAFRAQSPEHAASYDEAYNEAILAINKRLGEDRKSE